MQLASAHWLLEGFNWLHSNLVLSRSLLNAMHCPSVLHHGRPVGSEAPWHTQDNLGPLWGFTNHWELSSVFLFVTSRTACKQCWFCQWMKTSEYTGPLSWWHQADRSPATIEHWYLLLITIPTFISEFHCILIFLGKKKSSKWKILKMNKNSLLIFINAHF
jgi:hypothetical protein